MHLLRSHIENKSGYQEERSLEKEIRELRIARRLFIKLFQELKLPKLYEKEYLSMGLLDFVSDEYLEGIATGKIGTHSELYYRAKYFWKNRSKYQGLIKDL